MLSEATETCFLLYDNGCTDTLFKTPPQAIVAITTASLAVALVTTTYRFQRMVNLAKVGMDDCACAFALGAAILLYILLNTFVLREKALVASTALTVFIRFGWMSFHIAALWGGRVAVALTIVRFFTPGTITRISAKSTPRMVAIGVTIAFALIGCSLIAHKVLTCAGLNYNDASSCPIPSYIGYVEACLDVLGDTWLIAAPMYLVQQMQLAPNHRRLIIAVFVCSVFTGITSIIRAVYVARQDVTLIMLIGFVQAMVSIVNSNMLALISWVYRRFVETFSTDRSTSEDSSASRSGKSTLVLDLTSLGGSVLDYGLTDVATGSETPHLDLLRLELGRRGFMEQSESLH